MKQKLQDFVLIVKESRKAKFILIAVLLAILFLIFNPSGGPRKRLVPPSPEANETQIMPSESAQDILERFAQDVEQIKTRQIEVQNQLEEQRKVIHSYDERTAKIMKRMLNRITEAEEQIQDLSSQGTSTAGQAGGDGGAPIPEQDPTDLVTFGPVDEVPAEPIKPVKESRTAFVGAGDSVRVKLLSAVNAPIDGTPYPVVLKLVDDIIGPDGSRLPVGEARIIAAAQGSLVDSRVLFRLTSMNISFPSGKRNVVNVDGWIVGEDGILGLPGVPIDPIGEALAGAGLVGLVGGFGQGVRDANTTIRQDFNNGGGASRIVTGDTGEFALGTGISDAANLWQRILSNRLRQLVPVIQIYSGREATAVFNQSVPIQELYDEIEYNWNDFENVD
jgi:hypothetical protein